MKLAIGVIVAFPVRRLSGPAAVLDRPLAVVSIFFALVWRRFVDQLTAYLLTTDRVHAEEALQSLRSQNIPRPVEVIRNVRPLSAAHLPTLACQTEFCLVLDDDTVLKPGVVPLLLRAFRTMRQATPNGFKLNALVYSEARGAPDRGGLKLFHAPLLKKVGWPDAPHVSFAQLQVARSLGLKVLKCDIDAGVQKRGTNLDVYKKFLWIHFRQRAGQLEGEGFAELVKRASTGPGWLWFGVLGMVDGASVGDVSGSKDEDFMGPVARLLDFERIDGEDVRSLLVDRGLLRPDLGNAAAIGATPIAARGRA
jgi:hypothetical protein